MTITDGETSALPASLPPLDDKAGQVPADVNSDSSSDDENVLSNAIFSAIPKKSRDSVQVGIGKSRRQRT